MYGECGWPLMVWLAGIASEDEDGVVKVGRGRVTVWLRALRDDLGLSAGAPLLPLRAMRPPWLPWLPHLVVAAYTVVLAGFGWHTLIEDFGVETGLAGGLAITQAFALMVCLFWPSAGWWLSLAAAAGTTLAAHPGTGGLCGPGLAWRRT